MQQSGADQRESRGREKKERLRICSCFWWVFIEFYCLMRAILITYVFDSRYAKTQLGFKMVRFRKTAQGPAARKREFARFLNVKRTTKQSGFCDFE